MGRYLGAAPNTGSAVVRHNTVLVESDAWESESLEGVTQQILVLMEQVRSPSASTQRVDANGVIA